MIKKTKEFRQKLHSSEKWAQMKWISVYLRQYWKSILIYTLIGLVGTVFSLASGLISRNLVNSIIGHEVGPIIQTFILFIALSIGNILANQISLYYSNHISITIDNEIKAGVFSKIMVTDWESITNYHTGDLLTRWGSDASSISSGILNWIPNFVTLSSRFIGALAIMLHYDITFTLLALAGIPVTLLMSRATMKRMASNNRRSVAMSAKLSGFNQETFSNIQTIKAFDLVEHYQNRLLFLQKDYWKMRMDFQKMSMKTSIIMSLVGIIVSYSCYGWGIYQVLNGSISYGTMTMFLGMSTSLTGSLSSMTGLVPSAISISTSAGRLMDIINMPKEDYSHGNEADTLLAEAGKEGLRLKLEHVAYHYHHGSPVFQQVSLEAGPHEIIALVGPSGEGKTTMLRLILGLIQTQDGEAFIQQEKESSYPQFLPLSPSTRRLFSYVPQGNTMFSGTIAENMRNVKENATDEEIIYALKIACAWDFVKELPDTIDHEIKEHGGGFSEGQDQRLSIARALLHQAPFLLLDEATSALDIATERKVLDNIMKVSYSKSCIVTTHRPSVLDICNRVYKISGHTCHLLTREETEAFAKDF